MNKGIKCKFMMEGRFILREILGELETVQPCSFLPAYCGQEACGIPFPFPGFWIFEGGTEPDRGQRAGKYFPCGP